MYQISVYEPVKYAIVLVFLKMSVKLIWTKKKKISKYYFLSTEINALKLFDHKNMNISQFTVFFQTPLFF